MRHRAPQRFAWHPAPARNENHNLDYSNAALPQQNIVPEQ
jgi:hypothetical protein